MSGELPVAAEALLTAVVSDPRPALSIEQLRAIVPPFDFLQWIDHLQLLIDRGYVVRLPELRGYVYGPTIAGIKHINGLLHRGDAATGRTVA